MQRLRRGAGDGHGVHSVLGSFDSFGYRFFVLVAISYGLYFSVWGIVLGMDGVVAAGTSPMLYEPDLAELLEFLVVPVPLHLTVALVCNYVKPQAERQEQARLPSEAGCTGSAGSGCGERPR